MSSWGEEGSVLPRILFNSRSGYLVEAELRVRPSPPSTEWADDIQFCIKIRERDTPRA